MQESFYNKNADYLATLYLSKSFEQGHQPWLEYLTPILNKPDTRILDLGAGAGRDSKYMAQQGTNNNISVTAIEPAAMLAELGKQHTQGLNVSWLQDSLPDLITVTKQEVSFDQILLSAVSIHIITDWWQDAWLADQQSIANNALSNSQQHFFAEANIALPGLSANNYPVDDLFEDFLYQRARLKKMQQLREYL